MTPGLAIAAAAIAEARERPLARALRRAVERSERRFDAGLRRILARKP